MSYFNSRDEAGVISTLSHYPVTGDHMLPRHTRPVTAQWQCKYTMQEEMLHCSPESEGLAEILSLKVIMLRTLSEHWWWTRASGRMWSRLFTHKHPYLTKQGETSWAQQHRGVVFTTTVALHCVSTRGLWETVYSAAVDTNSCHQPAWPQTKPKVLFICESSPFIIMLLYRECD